MTHHRNSSWVRLGHGAYRPAADDGLRGALRGWAQWLPPDAVFTGLTACRVWGLWLPQLPAGLPIDVAVPPGSSRPRQAGRIRSTRVAMPLGWTWEGVRVAPVEEALLSSARALSELDLVVAIDSALQARATTVDGLATYASRRRAGAPALRRALTLADGRSESPYESLLRRFHSAIGVEVTPQVDLFAGDGAFIARADLLIDGTRTLQEYDGAAHRKPGQYRDDRRRDAALARAGFVRHGWVRPDLIPHGREVMSAADRAIGRRSDPGRLDRWHDMLRTSGYGSRDWSEIASRPAAARRV